MSCQSSEKTPSPDRVFSHSFTNSSSSVTLRAGFVKVTQSRSDWAPDPKHALPTFNRARRVPRGIPLIGRLFDEGTIARVGLAMEQSLNVVDEVPPGF